MTGLPAEASNQPPSWLVRPWRNTVREIVTGWSACTAYQSSVAGLPSKVTQ